MEVSVVPRRSPRAPNLTPPSLSHEPLHSISISLASPPRGVPSPSLLSRSCPSLDPLHPLRLRLSFSPVKLSTFLHHLASIPCVPKGLMPTPASPPHLLVARLSLTPPVSSYRICFSYAIPSWAPFTYLIVISSRFPFTFCVLVLPC